MDESLDSHFRKFVSFLIISLQSKKKLTANESLLSSLSNLLLIFIVRTIILGASSAIADLILKKGIVKPSQLVTEIFIEY